MPDAAIIAFIVALLMGGIPITILGSLLIQHGSLKLKLQARHQACEAYTVQRRRVTSLIDTSRCIHQQENTPWTYN